VPVGVERARLPADDPTMNVTASTAYQGVANADLRNQVSVAVARKSLDVSESQGQAAVGMIEAAMEVSDRALRVTPRPSPAPISAVPAPGEPGQRLDVTG